MMRFLAMTFAILLPVMAQADCVGRNLIAALPLAKRAALQATADAVPFARGNLWHATKGPMHVTVIGTYHMDDPRHAAILPAITPNLTAAKTLLVEAGPQEEAAMQADLAANPARLINPDATLPESLTPADWTRLSAALTERGIPPLFAAKLQPWYVATLLAVPTCQFGAMATAKGLDHRLIALATARGLPIMALEPFDTVFALLDAVPAPDQTDMLIETLSTTGPLEQDLATTLADSYFAGDHRLFWEFSRQQALDLPGADPARIARQFALVEDLLMTRRNRAWLPVIEARVAEGPLVVAFGALHLSGETGVLNLLAQTGWEISPW
ncbi:MAG: TraB/GumN family protein [Candidatus Saccharibacteria bacterium]|nr:TraB/GumN family protein [Pseudorhodobacter sp.]